MNFHDRNHPLPGPSHSRPVNVSAYRSIVRDHHGTPRTFPSRIETVIFNWRPSYTCMDGELNDSGRLPGDFDASHIEAIRQIVHHFSASVGMIEVMENDDWKPLCTCFLVKNGTNGAARVLTAGHALQKLMLPNSVVEDWAPLACDSFPARTSAGVRFAGKTRADEMRFPIASLSWAHPAWDILMCEIEGNPEGPEENSGVPGERPGMHERSRRTPLPLQTEFSDPTNADGKVLVPICVLGFPMRNDGKEKEERDVFSDVLLHDKNPVLHASPGYIHQLPTIRSLPFLVGHSAKSTTAGHDASTLPGNSGSPVFDLQTMKVVGLHFDGGKYTGSPEHSETPTGRIPQVADPNRIVYLPLALQEPFVKSELTNDSAAGRSELLVWDEAFPPWSSDPDEPPGNHENNSTLTDSPMLQSVMPDRFDSRDRVYRPSLLEAQDVLLPPNLPARMVRDQQQEGTCTAFALGATINMQLCKLGRSYEPVSERMLYELAKLYDEWMDDSVGGTSLRAVIKAFYQNGVCLGRTSPYRPGERGWTLTRQAAKEARGITLGAYYRLQPDLLDFQLALIETGAIIVSAHVHSGWSPFDGAAIESIPFERDKVGSHAFVIVGYNRTGFIIQNSWGKQWGNWQGQPGLAHWKYEDWAENLIDAWVLRLAPSTPDAFDLVPRIARETHLEKNPHEHKNPVLLPNLPRPRRFSLVGHTVQIEHDRIISQGRLGMALDSIRETALYLGSDLGREKYKSVALFFHDPHINMDTLLRLCMYQTKPFMAHGIYPIHIVYGLDEGYTIRLRSQDEVQRIQQLTARSGERISRYLDRRARDVLQPLYRSFRLGLERSTQSGGSLWEAISSIVLELDPDEQSLCVFASGLGFSAAEASVELMHTTLPEELDQTVSPVLKQFLLAPSCTLQQIENQPVAKRVYSLKVSSREAAVHAQFEGYWADLAKIAGHDKPYDPDAIRCEKFKEELENAQWYVGESSHSTLHGASADPAVLNDCLEFFAGYRNENLSFRLDDTV